MTDIVQTEWSGRHAAKDALRSRVWRRLKEEGVAPREPFGHIPSFVGAERAAARLARVTIWQSARVVKANPDTAHVALRLRALQEGKKLYMAIPRLTEESCFVELTAEALQENGVTLQEAAHWQGAMEHGRLVSPLDMESIDLVLVGCVAVSRQGGRIGKGAGFADLELGILRELDLLAPGIPIVTAVHRYQIVPDEALPMQPHDSPLDWIITPEEVIETNSKLSRPQGLDWNQIRPEQYEKIPVLNRIRSYLQPDDC